MFCFGRSVVRSIQLSVYMNRDTVTKISKTLQFEQKIYSLYNAPNYFKGDYKLNLVQRKKPQIFINPKIKIFFLLTKYSSSYCICKSHFATYNLSVKSKHEVY